MKKEFCRILQKYRAKGGVLLKKFSLHHLLLVGVAAILLVLIALIISFLPIGAKAKAPEEIHSLYRLEQTYIQQLEQMDKKQQKEAIEQLLDTVVQLPADGILWDGTTENNSLVASLAKEAATQNVGMVLTVASSMEQKDAEKQAKKLHLSGVCVQGVAQGKLVEYASLTEGLLPITLPDETGAELYAQWAQGTERAVIVASTGGQDSTALYQQLKQPPTQVQQGLVQQVELSIGLPQPEQSTTAEVHFAAGTANPDLPLTVNGQDVPVEKGGFWGIAIPLEVGENTITATQGEQTVSVAITRTKPKEGTWTPQDPQPDGSPSLEPGQRVRVTAVLASLLSDYEDDDSILQTVYQGAVAVVEESVEFTRGTKSTHAYKVAGGWLLAKDVEPLEGEMPTLSQVTLRQEERNTILRLEGVSPLVTAQRSNTSLTLYLSGITLGCELPTEAGFAQLTSQQQETGVALTFTFAENALWGWSIDYGEGFAEIILKQSPTLSENAQTPLAGITVLLDPGHGLEDLGALGPMGAQGPCEKDLNLAVALSAKQRLEQLGATVVMSRQEDVFPTLAERNQQLRQVKPDIFVSVHHNSIALTRDVNEVHGVECYYFHDSGKLLAQNLAQSVSELTQRNNRGDKYNYFYVTRSDICPAVLLEAGFVPNPAEYGACVQGEEISKAGYAIARGIQATVQGQSLVPTEN